MLGDSQQGALTARAGKRSSRRSMAVYNSVLGISNLELEKSRAWMVDTFRRKGPDEQKARE